MDETHKRSDDSHEMATDPRELDRGSEVYYHDGTLHYDTDSEPERAGRGWSAAMPDGQGGIGPKFMDMKIESENDGNLETTFKSPDSGIDYTK